MQAKLSVRDAWSDFYAWARTQPFWNDLTKKERKTLYDAQADYNGQRGQNLGHERIRSLLEKYAPGAYEFHAGEPYSVKK